MLTAIERLLDLGSVRVAQRAALWRRSAGQFFPGLSVRGMDGDPGRGSISGMAFGTGRLWSVLSPALRVSYDPSDAGDAQAQFFSVMLQLEGSTLARQQRRRCTLYPGDFCLIDDGAPFELEVSSPASHVMFVQMPRAAVLGRHPYLAQRTAEALGPRDPGAALLRGLLLNLLDRAPALEEHQRTSALAALIQLLGVAQPQCPSRPQEPGWRIRTALACIDAQLSDTTLSATGVAQAQGISRRRLDEIMRRTVGSSLTGQIWGRRLTQAATDLLDPARAALSCAQIAFAAGFEDPAHFTRAFKRRFHCTPQQWRRRGAVAAAVPARLS